MHVLITGVNGLLGQHLAAELLSRGQQVSGTGIGPCRIPLIAEVNFRYRESDLRKPGAEWDWLATDPPDALVHAAAMTQVDRCEEDRDSCRAINVLGTAELLTRIQGTGIRLIFLSTDFVFNGDSGNYSESEPPDPVNWYGACKAEAERLVMTGAREWCIIRTCLVYGSSVSGLRPPILQWVKDRVSRQERIQVVGDQWRTPTWVSDLVGGIVQVLGKKAQGIIHLAGGEVLTPYDMVVAASKRLGFRTELIERVESGRFIQPARRPLHSGLRIDKARQELDYSPTRFQLVLEQLLSGGADQEGFAGAERNGK
jgi:dTDP-4-dehydrorhamnose reductase